MEAERKYLRPPMADVRRRLQDLAATTQGAHFESNVILDNGTLLARGLLLRLRTQEWSLRSRHVLTCKYPPANAEALAAQGIKAREELELTISDAPLLERIFGLLGFSPVARYEKVREEWHLTFESNPCAVALDTLPFGSVAEIEAPPASIDPLAVVLGLDKCEISPKNYYELHRELTQSSTANILFSPSVREALRVDLHL